MNGVTRVLKQSPVFLTIEEDEIENLKTIFDKWEIRPGDVLTTAGEPAQYFFLLESGTILLAMDEGKAVVLKTPGDFIGMELLSARGIYKTTLTVLEKGSVFVVPRQDFLEVIRADTPAAASVMSSWQDYLDQTAPFAKNV